MTAAIKDSIQRPPSNSAERILHGHKLVKALTTKHKKVHKENSKAATSFEKKSSLTPWWTLMSFVVHALESPNVPNRNHGIFKGALAGVSG
jgi:hypothetical protein